MKRNYQKPAMRVVELKYKSSILVGSGVTSVRGNVFEDIESDENYTGDVR
jgi:hypothetical protein